MINSIGCSFDIIAFLIGIFGAFIMEFTRIIRDNKSLMQLITIGKGPYLLRIQKFNKLAILLTIVYIEIGGIIAGIFANTTIEAFLYGIFWEALFTFAISREKK